MKTLLTTLALLCASALLVACDSDSTKSKSRDYQSSIKPAPALIQQQTQPDPVLASVPEVEAPVANKAKNVNLVAAGSGAQMSKHDGTLYLATADGYFSCTNSIATSLSTENTVASLVHGDQHWVLQDDMLRSLDESVQVIPDFGSALTAIAGHKGDIFVGSDGEGVWQLKNGLLDPISREWDVEALAATDFGLFAATTDGLFSYDGERWHKRRLNDSSSVLEDITSLYYRYPYLYVGTDAELLTYNGGSWDQFVFGSAVTALGWHNARLYIGTGDGGLLTLEGTVLEQVASPEAGAVTSILRFNKRLHVATTEGLFRYKHGRFHQIDLEESTQREPETEPIASLQ